MRSSHLDSFDIFVNSEWKRAFALGLSKQESVFELLLLVLRERFPVVVVVVVDELELAVSSSF